MKLKVAKQKVWRTEDNKLVPDGHEKAHVLVAREGQHLREDQVEKFDKGDVSKFFSEMNPAKPETNLVGDHAAAVASGPAKPAKKSRKKSSK
jgi:hypothetical protein